jgi:two-component system, NtrC family, response regulator AtoC
MRVIADRFVETPGGRVVDLATGEDVLLTISSAGGRTDQLRWAERCDWFQRLFHPSLARLLDYGVLGEFQRFEAWQCPGPPCAASSRDACRAARWGASFLRACGLTAWSRGDVYAHGDGVRAVVVPDAGAGYPVGDEARSDNPVPAEQSGIVRVERCGVAALAEVFEAPLVSWREAQVVCIWGPEGSGKTVSALELARVARLNGFVPMSAHLLGTPVGDLLEGRAVCVIDDGQSAWRRGLIDVSIRSPRPHVVVCTAREDPRGIAGIRLARLAAAALVAAVRPTELAADPRIRRAAERADGLPGRFARLIHGTHYGFVRQRMRAAIAAAERAPVYGEGEVASAEPLTATPAAWPNPNEVCALRRRMSSARQQLAAGRHAPGDRDLRRAVGGLARRGDWTGAAEGSLALAASLLKRGRARDAKSVLDGARGYCQRSTSDDLAIVAATLVGVAWIDLARLGEAECVLTGAMGSELGSRRPCGAPLVLALSRCRFWQGRFVDADAALSTLGTAPADPSTIIRLHALQARIAVGRLDLTEAISSAAEAVRRAVALGDPLFVAEAHCAAAFAHLAVGDLASMQRDVDACAAAARAARDPLRALRVYLMLSEQLRRAGRKAAAIEVMKKMRRITMTHLPPILRKRCDLMSDLLTTAESAEDLAARHAAAAGLPALVLYGPRRDAGSAFSGVVEDALVMLRACQSADEERTTLAVVCDQAQRRLEAAAVAFFGIEGGASVRVAGSSRLDASVADRAAVAGLPIAPHRLDDRVEAAVPIRYGGAIVGALAARWLLNRSPDRSRAISTLTMAATAAAPLVQSILAERSRTATPATLGLLGVSPAMAEVRRAAERAANAPFAVLVEGESGSGKELVARAVHRGGARRDRPFRTLNCAALPDELVESELFGHARGAFTGAVAERVGVFEEAHLGTLLLDEVGELSLRAQAKLLRVIQEGELRRIGENVSRRIDVRIVSATNRDLRQEAAAGRFRLDLLYRLDVVRIVVPSLRERREDIPLLVGHFWGEAVARVGSRATLSPTAVAALARYDWPGNVRELQNVLSALAVRVGHRGIVAPAALPPQFDVPLAASDGRLNAARRAFDERYVRAALVRTGGSRARAAAELGISRQGLTKLMTRLGIADGAL